MPVNNTFQIRRGTNTQWTNSNPVLASGEPGYDTTNNIFKIGDGTNNWSNLKSVLDITGDVAISGLLSSASGNFGNLTVNSVNVSVSGHSHNSSDITDFNSSVSGLLPVKNILAGDHVVVSSLSGIYTVNASGTSSNFPQTLVLRDSLGNFVANEPTFNIVQLNPSSGVIEQDIDLNPAEIAWNSDQGTLDYGLIGNGTNLIHHIGQEIFYRVHNGSPSTLYAGMAVSASGVNAGGRKISVVPYVSDGSVRENRFVGIVSSDILTGETGYVTHFGFVRKLDTRSIVSTNYSNAGENWQIGDILYVDPTTPGKLTKFEPKHSISVAIITNVNANNGLIFVRPTSYGHLDDNHDVAVSGATNGQFLQYNSVTDYWVPSSSGNFSTLLVNGSGVSLNGHTHTTSNITDFNSSVSGLLPNIANSGDNRVLTSTGSSVGTNAETNLIFDGSRLGINTSSPSGNLHVIGSGIISSITGVSPNATMHIYSAISGNTIFNVEGTNGSLFSVDDNLSGSLMSVNNSAGLPVFEVFSDDRIVAGRFNQNDFIVNSSGNIGIGTSTISNKMQVSGNVAISGLLTATSGNYISGLQVNGTDVSVSGHTHSSSDITNFNSSVSGLLPVTNILGGTNISIVPSGSVFTVNVSGSLGLTTEEVDDRVSDLLIAGSGIVLDYNDSGNTLTISTSGLQPSGDYSINGHTHSASDITSGTLSNDRLSINIINASNLYLWSSFR